MGRLAKRFITGYQSSMKAKGNVFEQNKLTVCFNASKKMPK